VELAAAEVYVRARGARRLWMRVRQQVDEARERDLHARPHGAPEVALHVARVAGHLAGDRRDRLVGEPGQHWA
jgi:hypothetical protein